MDLIEEIQPEGVAVCQPGVRLGDLENEGRKTGWELRCYPRQSSRPQSEDFSAAVPEELEPWPHECFANFQTVRAIEVVTMEPEPRLVLHEGEAVHEILHAWGNQRDHHSHWLL